MDLSSIINGMANNGEPKNIWVAAGDGDLARVQELIGQGQSVDQHDENGYTPLHAAVSYGRMEVLAYLLSAGADVNTTDTDGDTPLHVCETVEVAQVLLQAGANPAARNAEGKVPAENAIDDENEDLANFLKSVSQQPDSDQPPDQP
ncbi:unnamed protein product [Heterosigma akashiwo]|mmetsp:Transcript_9497/g.15001  ORF Transcript_9497/g.15001 Transcript_9497/m.15001 type:complete len:147 (+) Transcript_9497:85-525(+)